MVFKPVNIWSIKSVSDLMTHQEIINISTGVPVGQGQDTGMDVKICSLYILVLNHQIFGGKQFSKLRFDLVGNSHLSSFVWTHNTTKPASCAGSCDAF